MGHRPVPVALALAAALTVIANATSGPDAGQGAARLSPPGSTGARDPAWSPDGRRIAVSVLDRIHVIGPDGRGGAPITEWDGDAVEREPAWSPDGARIVFAADRGDGFDLYVVDARGGRPAQLGSLPGDDRRPAYTSDGRVVFARHIDGQWDLAMLELPAGPGAAATPVALTVTPHDEREPTVSLDGQRIAFVSTRDSDDGGADLWVGDVPERRPDESAAARFKPSRVARLRGDESWPSWSPSGGRLAFAATRDGVGTLWVTDVAAAPDRDGVVARPRPETPAALVSRHLAQATWSADGRQLLLADLPDPQPSYNGNPRRDASEPPPLFATGDAFRLRVVPAPIPPDTGSRSVALGVPQPAERWTAAYDRVVSSLGRLYYDTGPMADVWRQLASRLRTRAARASRADDLEAVLDDLVAQQPLIRPEVSAQSGALVVAGHPLAAEAGAAVLARGGNVVDAAIAVGFALGVVEPDASGIGGDGMALVLLGSMTEPVVVDYKDQTPMRATLDNPAIFRDGRLVADGPAAANIPGMVAGLDLLHKRFGSGRVPWAELVAPAIALAENGFVLDGALPTSLQAGRSFLERYPEAARVFLPDGHVPKAGDRFVNRDLGATLRAIANDGAATFYRGGIARRIAEDMARNGGLMTEDDLAQYRAIERRPVSGRYRGHTVYSSPPPVSTGAALIESLQILDRYRPRDGARAPLDADYFHYLIESWKVRDANRRIADPALWPVDLGDHLSEGHALELFKQIDPRRASPRLGDREDRPGASTSDGGGTSPGAERIGSGTTAFVVADARGNVVVATQTLSTWGGSFYVSRNLGFLYNNHLRSNRTARGAYGQLMPLMRSSSASVPTLVMRDREGRPTPWIAVAAAGNAWIPASVYSIITAVVDGGLTAQPAIEAPRFLVARDPADARGQAARIQIEDRFPRTTLDTLASRGHQFQKIGRKGEVRYGYAALAVIDTATARVDGGAEPRRSHAVVASQSRTAPTEHGGGRPR